MSKREALSFKSSIPPKFVDVLILRNPNGVSSKSENTFTLIRRFLSPIIGRIVTPSPSFFLTSPSLSLVKVGSNLVLMSEGSLPGCSLSHSFLSALTSAFVSSMSFSRGSLGADCAM